MTISPALRIAPHHSFRSWIRLVFGALLTFAFLAATTARAQTPQRIYELNGSYAETNGGSALVPNGGTLGASGYTFAAGQGPNVSNALANTGEYSIEVLFRIDDTSGYRNLINFNNRTGDNAVYCLSGKVQLYSYTTGNSTTTDFIAGQTHRLVVTRNATTKVTTAYVDGVQKGQVTDSNNYYVASGANGILHFFRDDSVSGENASGFVDQIRIYDSVLTPTQVAALGQTQSTAPDIQLKGNSTVIVDGDTTPSATDHTHFGSVSSSLARTFTIENTGTAALTVSSITATGDNASEFVVTEAPTSVSAGTLLYFTVTYTPSSGVATSRAKITINSNDADEAAYDFLVEGEKAPGLYNSTWTARTAAQNNRWRSITYANGLFVAVSDNGLNQVMTSPDGSTWTARSAAQANSWHSVTYGNGLFVAVSENGTNQVMTSPDGFNWTARSTPQANLWRSVTYGNGLFVAVSENGINRVMTSPDGATWTTRSAAEANRWYSVAYGNGRFVAVSISGTNRIMTSLDGITWSSATTALGASNWRSVTYGNGRFVAVADLGTQRAATSIDGLTWTANTSPPASGWVAVTYGNGLYVAIAENGTNRVMTSPDGATWTAGNATAANSWYSVAYGKDRFVSLSTDGTDPVMVSGYPEVAITGNSTAIADGETTASTTNHTHFGQRTTALARTFTITNTGGIPLSISSITSTGPDAARFVISGAPTSVAIGSSATFTVTFTPLAGTVSRATITVNNNDPDEAAYDFAVEGSFTPPTVTTVLPSEGTTAGGTSLTITGTGFGGDTTVTIGGVAATGVNVYSPTLLTCIAPAGTVGAKSVVVTNAAGANSANTLYTYVVTTPGGLQALNATVVGNHVLASIVQPDGKIVIGGKFTQVLGVTRNHIARLNADGSLDASFNPNAGWEVSSLQLQPDGKILVGGSFLSFQPNGASSPTTRNRIARLNADGSLDTSFDPNANNVVNALCLQPDGKILVGGVFTALQPNGAGSPTTRTRLARLNADGTLDPTFSPAVDSDVFGLSVAADGRILIGGAFTTVQSTGSSSASPWSYLARLSATGVLDTDFLPLPNNKVWSLLTQPDGKIVLGGEFTTLQPNGATSPTTRNRIARINTNGTLDTTFAPSAGGIIFGLALQADGKLLGAGNAGVTRWSATGTVDSTFNPGPNGTVYSLALQPDGRVLLGGSFTAVGGTARSYFARVNNDVATNTLSVPNLTQVVWVRGGSAPELSQVTIEQSTNGASWSSLGTPTLVAGTANWQITGITLPNGVLLRARGRTSGGYFNASSTFVEQVAGFTNATPADINLSASTLAENNPANSTVGTLATTDANSGDLFAYTLVAGTGSTDNASFTLSGATLRLTPVADFETKSSYALRIRSTDTGGQFFEKAFTVSITNVNETPSFTKGADIVVPHSTNTTQTVSGWATAINDGDSTVTQSLTFNVTVTGGANLFSTAPAISSTGELTYRPNGTAGIATVQVTLTDDATAGTSALTTAAQTFTITVQAPPLTPFLGSISPTSGTSAGGTTVTITGTNLSAVNAVSFGGTPATGFVINSDTSITAVTPAGTPGVANVAVATSGGTNASNPLFTYFAPTTTTLTSSQNPSPSLSPPTFTARAVSAQTGLTGQMELFIDNVLFQAKAVDASGFATFTPPTSALGTGTRSIRAVYNANGAATTFGTSSATLSQTVQRSSLPITLTGLAQTYDGTPKPVGATVTIPSDYTATVTFTYAGSATAPTNAGSYPVVASLDHPQFFGSATGTLVVAPSSAGIAFIDTLQAYDGTPRVAGVVTFPPGIPATLTYQTLVNGSPSGAATTSAPLPAGRYRLAATTSDPNYILPTTAGELYVTKRGVSISLSGLYAIANGQPKPVTVTTQPAGIAVIVTYAFGSTSTTVAPSLPPAGGLVWRVNVTVADTASNMGTASGDLRIDDRVPAPITLTGPATANPYEKPTYIARVTPIRPGVRPSGTMIFKNDGNELLRVTPDAAGQCVLPTQYFPVRSAPYAVIAEYTGDENYLPTTSTPVNTTITKKLVTRPARSVSKIYDGKPYVINYTGQVFEGYVVASSTTTYNGGATPPQNVTSSPVEIVTVGLMSAADIEFRETIYLTINKSPSSIRLANLVQTIRPTLNHKPEVFTEPAGAPYLISINGTIFMPGHVSIYDPGTYAVRAWISDPNYESAEATGIFSLTLARAVIEISNLEHNYDGAAKTVSVKTTPAIAYTVTYNGSTQPPNIPGIYTVRVTPNISGYGTGTTATMVIKAKVSATVNGAANTTNLFLSGQSGSMSGPVFISDPDSRTLEFRNTSTLKFKRWKDGSKENPRKLLFSDGSVSGSYNYDAEADTYIQLKTQKTGEGDVLTGGTQIRKVGEYFELTAIAKPGYVVESWQYDGKIAGPADGHKILQMGREALIKARSCADTVTVNFVQGYMAETYVMGGVGSANFVRKNRTDMEPAAQGGVPNGVNFIATAQAGSGYRFTHWQNSNTAFVNSNQFSNPAEFRYTGGNYASPNPVFIKDAPVLSVDLSVVRSGTDPLLFNLPVTLAELSFRNTGGKNATNLRIHRIEPTGYKIKFRNDPKEYQYYPSPRDEAESSKNNQARPSTSERSRLIGLSPIPYFELTPSITMSWPPTLKVGDSIYVGTVSSTANTRVTFLWPEGDITVFPWVPAIFADSIEVRLTLDVSSNEFRGKIDVWTDLAIHSNP